LWWCELVSPKRWLASPKSARKESNTAKSCIKFIIPATTAGKKKRWKKVAVFDFF